MGRLGTEHEVQIRCPEAVNVENPIRGSRAEFGPNMIERAPACRRGLRTGEENPPATHSALLRAYAIIFAQQYAKLGDVFKLFE